MQNGRRELTIPFSDKFVEIWDLWKEYKQEAFNFKYKSVISEQSAIEKLYFISYGDEEVAISIVKESMSNQWEGFYALKIKQIKDGKRINRTTGRESLHAALSKRFGGGEQDGNESGSKGV